MEFHIEWGQCVWLHGEGSGAGRLMGHGCHAQATWNLLEQSVGPALTEAHAAGMSVLVKEAMANGRLTPRNQNPAFASRLAALGAAADAASSSMDALALACVMAQPFRPVVLSGATTPAMLAANAAAMELAARLDAGAVERLCAAMVQPPEEYWAERGALTWN